MTSQNQRKENEKKISQLYGCPGTEWDTDSGREILLDTIEKIGIAALTDQAVTALAAAQIDRDAL